MTARYAHVILPLPLDAPYTYSIPAALEPRVVTGARVLVPVRNRKLTGIVAGIDAEAPRARARDIAGVMDEPPAVSAALLATAKWIAGYYAAPLGLAVRALLPAALWGGERGSPLEERVLVLSDEAPTLVERDSLFGRRRRQRELYEAVESMGGTAPVRHLEQRLGFSSSLIRALAATDLARIEATRAYRDPFRDLPGTSPPTPSPTQDHAITAISALEPGKGAVLFGVTGSGKTLVYIEAVRRVLDAGGGAIVLVPEIALTPQTVSRFRGAFGELVAVLHSGLSDGERADAWQLLRDGRRRVAVGARSAIFAPVQNLGIVVVDEEHEASYKNGESPRYHARDVAAVRARIEGARLVLGSATPSLESMEQVAAGTLKLLGLDQRIEARPMPPVELVDLRSAPLVRETAPVPWSAQLDDEVSSALGRGEQVLLLLNRRGFANFLQCRTCGEVQDCPNCSVALTVHHGPDVLRCHHCGHEAEVPVACPACGGTVQQMRGVGTQKLEEMLAQRFPEARLARMDLDTTSSRWAHHRILSAVERGDVDLLVGTQMIAKGLDFPNVTLVGVVDADTALYLPDFRAAERTYQLLAQVAGRAGRGPRGGKVLVQTRSPQHHALAYAVRHDTPGFLRAERELRRSPPYPPEVSLANYIVSGLDEEGVRQAALGLLDWCTRAIEKHGIVVTLLGPAPCPLARVKERWRWHLVVKGPGAEVGKLVRGSRKLLRQMRGAVTVTVDRDPASLA
jgi:primosomal protein N' (replication factor Y)